MMMNLFESSAAFNRYQTIRMEELDGPVARLARPEDMERLSNLPISDLYKTIGPEKSHVVIVEKDGEIVAVGGLFEMLHWEGSWISGGAGTTRAFLEAIGSLGRSLGATWILAGSDSEKVSRILRRLGGERWPMEEYIMPLDKRS